MRLRQRAIALTLAINLMVVGVIIALAPMSAHAALQDTPIVDFPETNGEVYAIAPASDGSVYVGGRFTSVDGVSRRNVARILSDNSVDPDFNPSIYADGDNPDVVNSFVLDEGTSTLYVGGGFNTVNGSTPRNNVAAVNSETGLVTTFNPNVNGTVHTLELNQDDDILYAGGSFTTVNGGTSRKDLAAFSTNTSTATAFDADINTVTCDEGAETVYDLLFDANTDRLYIAGHFYSVAEHTSRGLAAVNPTNGTPDEAFSPDIRYSGEDADLGQCPEVYSVEKIGSTIYAGGFFDNVNSGAETNSYFAAFSATTGVVTDLDVVFDSVVYDMTIDPISGNLYLGGSFSMINGSTQRNEVAAINLDTNELMSFNPNITTAPPDPSVHTVAFNDRGYFYTGGTFDHVGGDPRTSLAAFANPDTDDDGITSDVEDAAPNNGDANNDGTPDAEQANVTSLVNTETDRYVTVVTPDGTTITTVSSEAAPDESGMTHLFGLVGFTVIGLTTGDTIPIEIFYPNPDEVDASTITPKKYFPSTARYEELEGATVTGLDIDSQPTLRLSYSLTDGGAYDLDQTADGQITDPVSLATTNRTTDALADTGENVLPLVVTACMMVFIATMVLKRRQIFV